MTECKSCGGDIRWGRTERGKGLPLNPQPSDSGELVLVSDDGNEIIVRPITNKDRGQDVVKYVNHQQTCVNADKWRRGKR